jgi:hypothetical protein
MIMQEIMVGPRAVHYLPIVTTLLSAIFCAVLLRRYRLKGQGAHLLWWAGGIFCYGLGTALEGLITLLGNSPLLNKAWYIAGALLGGYPLAQGSVYLLLPRRTAHVLTALTVPFILVFSLLVALSPADPQAIHLYRPSGKVLGWSWIRAFTPVINTYAVFFLIGGAILSAIRYAQQIGTANRAIGNALIAFGALLPGIGGGMTKLGHVEWLYVCEFVGLLFIWAGYACCVHRPRPADVAADAYGESPSD